MYESKLKKTIIISQTTFSLDRFNKYISLSQEEIKDKNIELEIKHTICDATRLRQEETKKISNIVDMMIIIGGKHSSNTNKLYEIAKKNCKNSILIETYEELDLEQLKKYNKIGIMAGASTPKKSTETVVELLKNIW